MSRRLRSTAIAVDSYGKTLDLELHMVVSRSVWRSVAPHSPAYTGCDDARSASSCFRLNAHSSIKSTHPTFIR